MYTNVLYVIISLLITVSLLLFLVLQVLRSRAKSAMNAKIHDDLERIENLPAPQGENATVPPVSPGKTGAPFAPSTSASSKDN